ncbi:polyphosphate kinase 2 family protein [Thalassiella azotivora]
MGRSSSKRGRAGAGGAKRSSEAERISAEIRKTRAAKEKVEKSRAVEPPDAQAEGKGSQRKGSQGKGSQGKGSQGKGSQGKQSRGKQSAAPAATATDLRDVAADASAVAEALRVGEGFDLSAVDTRATPGFRGGKAEGKAALAEATDELSDLQERFWAERTAGSDRSLLLVVQGMDTSGKGGVLRHVVGAVDPQGVEITAFKAPTAEERSKPFLWRIRRALPAPGHIGVFDRSHYEDVLVVRVHDLVEPRVWRRRYDTINRFEAQLVERGTTVVKVMLHVSRDEQRSRLLERLDRPDKHWKYHPGDVDERLHWDDYQEAYQAVLDRCSTEAAPWYVVPADRKWYARWAVQQLLLHHLRTLDPQWPVADVDVDAERERLLAT